MADTAPLVRAQLADDLRRLGVCSGDILFVHSSFKSLGPVEGGAATVVAALEDAVSPGGLLLMPSFNLLEKGNEARAAKWNVATTPSSVGWLTEFFRQMPGTVRSDHFSHSVAARGARAEEFVGGHRRMEGMESPWDMAPWGRAFGAYSPMIQAYAAGGKVLMLGVDYHSSTYMHVIEVMWWNERRRTVPAQPYIFIDRDRLGVHWDGLGRQRIGRVGQAECRLFDIKEFVGTLLDVFRRSPQSWTRWWPTTSPAQETRT